MSTKEGTAVKTAIFSPKELTKTITSKKHETNGYIDTLLYYKMEFVKHDRSCCRKAMKRKS